MDKDFDLIDIMNGVRKSKIFLKNFMTREQKVVMRYDVSNVVDGSEESPESGAEPSDSDFDDVIAKNLQSKNGFTAMLTLAKISKILEPYTKSKKLNHFDWNLFKSFLSKEHLLAVPKEEIIKTRLHTGDNEKFSNKISQQNESDMKSLKNFSETNRNVIAVNQPSKSPGKYNH